MLCLMPKCNVYRVRAYRILATALLLLTAATLCRAQTETIADWQHLIATKKCAQAKTLCTAYVYSVDTSGRIESQKCLAQVSICGPDARNPDGTYSQESVDTALAHLDRALKLGPQDLSIHRSRLQVLESTGRYDAMAGALDQSCDIYKGPDALPTWLPFAGELTDLHQYQAGLAIMQVLNNHYPNNAVVLDNLGDFLVLLNRSTEAIPYLQRGASLAPHNSYVAWDLARAYDAANQLDLANRWYKKALPLSLSARQLRDNTCTYGHFLETKMHDRPQACKVQKTGCDPNQQTACTRENER